MGYWSEQTDGQFRITADRKAAAFNALYSMWGPGREDEMTGGRWDGHIRLDAWYAWTDATRWRNQGFATLEEGIKDWGFTPTVNADGDVMSLLFADGEMNKLGQAGLMFQVIAPYVEAGSYLAFRGEDGAEWRWQFDGAAVHELVVAEA